jgi:hypothetical protein
MNNVHCIKASFLIVILLTFIGCKSKQDKPGASVGTPQEKTAATVVQQQDKTVVPAMSPQEKAVAPVMSPQDKVDARAAAVHVIALMETGDFPSIYKNSAAGFKQLGSESQFVAKFQQTRKRVGILKNPQEISIGTLPGNGYVFVYRLENDSYKTDLRLTFTRTQSGKMELAGLNQHDELKK